MKKVLLILALVAAYGVSMAISSANVVIVDHSQATIVAYDNNVTPEGEKEKSKEAKVAKSEAKSEGCATAKSEAKSEGCATAKSEGCGEKSKTASNEKKAGEGTK